MSTLSIYIKYVLVYLPYPCCSLVPRPAPFMAQRCGGPGILSYLCDIKCIKVVERTKLNVDALGLRTAKVQGILQHTSSYIAGGDFHTHQALNL